MGENRSIRRNPLIRLSEIILDPEPKQIKIINEFSESKTVENPNITDGKDKDGVVHTRKILDPEHKIQTRQDQCRHTDYRLLLVH